MIKPKRKVSIFSMYKLQFYILGFLLSSMVVSYFFIILDKSSKLTFSNWIVCTFTVGITLVLIFGTACYFIYLLFRYLKILPSIIAAKDKISRIPLTREELVYLNINSLEEYFEYIQENIKSTHGLFDKNKYTDILTLNDCIFFNKKQSDAFQSFTNALLSDACNGEFNFYKENSYFKKNNSIPRLSDKAIEFNLVIKSMYADDIDNELFKNVFASVNYERIEIIIRKCNSKYFS